MLKVVEGGKEGGKKILLRKGTANRPKSLASSFRPRATSFNFKRFYCNGKTSHEVESGPIVTVDKWGVQRETNEVANSKEGKTSYTHGAPATEMVVFEVSRLNFQETLQSQAPVIIMAYLPSSELSMQLDEQLQMRVNELGGAVRLGRLNASVEQELAVALKLTQLPTVLGVFGGRMVSSFVGLPDAKVLEQFMDLMLRVGGQNQLSEMYRNANQLLEQGDIQAAREIYNDILQDRKLRAEAIALAGLIRCSVAEGNLSDAQELSSVLEQSYAKDLPAPEVQQALTALELALTAGGSVGSSSEIQETIEKLSKAISDNPNDLDSRFALSNALWASSQQQAAVQALLDMIKIDKHWNEQSAKKLLLKYWESLGPDHPLTISSRKRFSSLWF